MSAQLRVTTDSSAQPPVAASNASAPGISTLEAQRLLALNGPNALPDVSSDPWRAALAKFWAPVPWMLEAAIVLELVLGKFVESALIGALLVFNAALGAIQEGRAQSTLASLRSRLALRASVFRDGDWMLVAAETVVLGDRIKLSLGGVVPADALVVDGHILADQSMLTGESLPVDLHAGSQTWAGSLVRGGEAIATVTATGANTKFGRTATLVQSAHVVSSQQKADGRRAKSRSLQRCGHRAACRVCVVSTDARVGDHSADPDGVAG